jgi:hypothetical protein
MLRVMPSAAQAEMNHDEEESREDAESERARLSG